MVVVVVVVSNTDRHKNIMPSDVNMTNLMFTWISYIFCGFQKTGSKEIWIKLVLLFGLAHYMHTKCNTSIHGPSISSRIFFFFLWTKFGIWMQQFCVTQSFPRPILQNYEENMERSNIRNCAVAWKIMYSPLNHLSNILKSPYNSSNTHHFSNDSFVCSTCSKNYRSGPKCI